MVQLRGEVVGEITWDRFMQPMYRSLNGEDPRYTNLDNEWDDDDPEALDIWKSDEWIGGQPREDMVEKARRVEQQEMLDTASREGGATGFTLPTITQDDVEGASEADRFLASRGRDPSKKGGSGQLFDVAREFIGTPYVFGAAGPDAFDCSGFTKYLFSRVYGVSLPHQALQQQQVTQRVSRRQLQPGDLIFYSYGRLGAQVDHVEVYMGGNKQIGTSNPSEDLDIDDVDWSNVHSFGRVNSKNIGEIAPGVAGGGRGAKDPRTGKPVGKVVETPVEQDTIMTPAMLSGEYGSASFSTVLAEVLTGDETIQKVKYKSPSNLNAVEAQLYRGFIDGGRPDLARMVGTKDFHTWIQQESGWNVDATSPANNNGLANDGLFQIWRGHEYNSNGQVSRMSPYEQAMLVTKYFGHLNPNDIRRYAEAIRSGSYSGWG